MTTKHQRLLILGVMLGMLLMVLATRGHSATKTEIDKAYANRLVVAIYKAEGGDKTKHPYGIVSIKPKNKEHARQICLNTVKNNWRRWQAKGGKGDFILFLANVYAPVKASNDPKGLNAHWPKNVKKIVNRLESCNKVKA